jgi:EpsI family protein
MRFIKSPPALVVTLLLALHAIIALAVTRQENPPPHRPLAEFPDTIGEWRMAYESQIEPEILEVLKADDTLSRAYQRLDASGAAFLSIAYFSTQRTGANPHSPKNCLPGAGWIPIQTGTLPVTVPGRDQPVRVNRYVVAKGGQQSVVLYWYQGRGRVIASEYVARIYVVADALNQNRTDVSLVKITVPMLGDDVEAATNTAVDMAQASFPVLEQFLPD